MAGEGNLNMGMSESDIKAMKDALCSQQQLLQKLYAELDVEREASATAVSEALSMILRLQEEKSLVKMEATQYKRMTEEKISHAEESLANFEDRSKTSSFRSSVVLPFFSGAFDAGLLGAFSAFSGGLTGGA